MHRQPTEHHVLLVTANEGRQIQLTRLLGRAGYGVIPAVSPREALHYLAQAPAAWAQAPAVMLVDQESLGVAASRIIRAVRNAELELPMVVVSAFGAADDVIACLRAGAADYISLPAEPAQILDVLARVVAAPTVT